MAVRVSIAPDLRLGRSRRESAAMLLILLDGIRRSGSIAEAARAAGCSYRHAWGLIRRWKTILGWPLASLRQGRGTHLTPLGEHLLWVDRQIKLRVAPLFAELAGELERELVEVFEVGRQRARGRKQPNSIGIGETIE